MPDQWKVTGVIETADNSGRIPAWEVTLTRLSDDVSLVMFLPQVAIENAAVTYGLQSTDEAISVILHQTVLPLYEPEAVEANPWQVSAEQARAQVVERIEHCQREHATVEMAAPARRAAGRSAPDVLTPLREHVRVDPMRCAALRLEAMTGS
ncbi:hypothetical protein [Streptosporangium sp. H16]|uniref:hypothetical protein n=1 Tax=Streptosporangium sp. H16 TaxID=3444184 RepID=UPI003F79FA14